MTGRLADSLTHTDRIPSNTSWQSSNASPIPPSKPIRTACAAAAVAADEPNPTAYGRSTAIRGAVPLSNVSVGGGGAAGGGGGSVKPPPVKSRASRLAAIANDSESDGSIDIEEIGTVSPAKGTAPSCAAGAAGAAGRAAQPDYECGRMWSTAAPSVPRSSAGAAQPDYECGRMWSTAAPAHAGQLEESSDFDDDF